MKSILLMVFFMCLSQLSYSVVSEDTGKVEAKKYFDDFNTQLSQLSKPKRGIASLSSSLSTLSLKENFLKKKWFEYANLNEEIRAQVLDQFEESQSINRFDEMVKSIFLNKNNLSINEKVKSARARGQYDAFLMWQK